MLESTCDLQHLLGAKGSVYFERLRLTSALERQKEAERIIASRVSDATATEVVAIAKATAKDAKAVVDELQRGKGLTRLSVAERVSPAGLGDEIAGIYHALCFEAHGDIQALVRRHLRGVSLTYGTETLNGGAAMQVIAFAYLLCTLCIANLNDFATVVHVEFATWVNAASGTARELMALHGAVVHELGAASHESTTEQ